MLGNTVGLCAQVQVLTEADTHNWLNMMFDGKHAEQGHTRLGVRMTR
jgi:hypothetical protein